ncbi:MAG: nucleotide exchange factor GrpE [Ignavibacteriae bacterium]|nr:MAG: nucleotide exchange factor GrpE [Ignavibacteriota bacterium]
MKKNDDRNRELEKEEISENEEPLEEEKNEDETDFDEKMKELEEKNEKLQDSLLRKIAEFENYKRRTENDQMNLLKYSAESFILKMLPVYDDLGRSVTHIDKSNQDSLRKGLQLVYDKFTKILEEQGVTKLEVEGKEFDVDYHEALMQQPSDEVPDNTIITEVEPGYIYKDKVIRHAKVIVSQEIESNSDTEKENEEE